MTIRDPSRPGSARANSEFPVCMQMTVKAIPQLVRMLERFPKVRVILDHLAKPSLSDGPPYAGAADVFRLADYKNLVLETHPRTVAEAQNGKATHATFFPLLVSKFGASRIAWGSNYPASEGTLPEITESFPSGSVRLVRRRSRLDFRARLRSRFIRRWPATEAGFGSRKERCPKHKPL